MTAAYIARRVVSAYGHRDALRYCFDQQLAHLIPALVTGHLPVISSPRHWILWQDAARCVLQVPAPVQPSRTHTPIDRMIWRRLDRELERFVARRRHASR